MDARNRRGLVLVEAMALIGIGTVALGLILPQIQAAREAARRAQCTNNMKQMGLAIHNYLSANDSFPMSAVQGKGRSNGHSGFTCILSYMELAPLYNTYNFSLENWHESNETSMKTKLATFLCPSNKLNDPLNASEIKTSHLKAYEGKNKFAAGHYGMNWGGVRTVSGIEQEKAYGEAWRGVLLTVVDPDSNPPTTNVKLIDIKDGTSNTIMIAEKLDSFGWGVGGWGGSEFDVNLSPVDPGKEVMPRRVFTGSMHPTGMNVLIADGSVRFMTAKTQQKTWYALTTRASGEEIKPEDLK